MDDLAAKLLPAASSIGLAHRVRKVVGVEADSQVRPKQIFLPYNTLYLCAGLCFFWNGGMEAD
jgi:hypothetical protein